MVIAADASTHGSDLTYEATVGGLENTTVTHGEPGLVSGDTCVLGTNTDPSGSHVNFCALGPCDSGFWLAGGSNFYIRGWIDGVTATRSTAAIFVEVVSVDGIDLNLFINTLGGPTHHQMEVTRRYAAGTPFGAEGVGSTPGTFPTSGPHQYAVVYDQSIATYRFYLDGVQFGVDKIGNGFTNGHFAPTFPASDPFEVRIGQPPNPGSVHFDEVDYGPTAPSAAQIAADYAAAATSFGAYTAAALTHSPWGYYHLNDGSAPPPPTEPGWYLNQIGMAS